MPRLLGVGEVPVHDHDLLALISGQVGAVPDLLPAHGGDRLDVLGINEGVPVAEPAQQGDQLVAEAHLRRPESGEAGPVEQVSSEAQPPDQLLLSVGCRDQRQDGVVVAGAKDFDHPGVLQVPQQRATVDDAVDALLEGGVGQCLQQRAGQRQMHPGDVLMPPEPAGDAIDRPQNLVRLVRGCFEQVL
jgi:hypothetical protein